MRCCRDRKVGRDDRLSGAALRREDGDDTTVAAELRLAGGLRRLLDHEEHALAAGRQREHVGDAGVERPADEPARRRGRREHDRCAAVLAQLRQLLAGLRLALVHEHCDVERLRVVAPGELSELEGVQRGHPLAQRGRRLAVTGEGDAEAAISGHWSPR